MFLEITRKRNPKLIEIARKLHKTKKILPDTYVIDVDAVLENAKMIKESADKYGIKLYYMSKQLGRNPYICKKIDELGYEGAVVVDYKEARVLHNQGVKIGHVGHLVQIPDSLIENILEMNPQIITVYSIEKAKKINEAAKKKGIIQSIMLKIYKDGDLLYPGQYSGFEIEKIDEIIEKLKGFKNIKIDGITHFPCFLYDEKTNKIEATHNLNTVIEANKRLEKNGIKVSQLNLPSSTCVKSMGKIAEFGGTHGEPGHGLSGTTPFHNELSAPELPAIVYVSEISHNFQGHGYIYGGGHYRRSHVENIILGGDAKNERLSKVVMPSPEAIDYYFEIEDEGIIGEATIMAFRTQIFVTRSDVALVEGLSKNSPKLVGIYDSLGRKL
ncbi:alanine racemase [Psychrilyobacter atlanticus]|uniref:alanine racemase n=1 Tax=Psychrilyobacter atlanticus TaxID=271091 RepID=UPI00040D249B|nr:alanine racemase [Psychrilyobacter atlanticus]